MKIQRRRSDRAGRTVDTMKQLYDKQQVFGFVGNVGTPTAVVALPYALDQARRRRNQCCAGAASQVPPAGGPEPGYRSRTCVSRTFGAYSTVTDLARFRG